MKVWKVLLVAGLSVAVASAASATVLNEFLPNPVGSDPATTPVELLGIPGDSFTGWILGIESDIGGSIGLVDRATQVSGTFDAITGLLVVDIPDFENPSFTAVLLDTFSGTIGTTDIDVDNDGVVDDVSAFGTVLDALNVPDSAGDETGISYGSDLGGTNLVYIGDEPQLVFREATTLQWYALDDVFGNPIQVFDPAGNVVNPAIFDIDPTVSTLGSINPAIPEPATLTLLVLGGLTMLRRR